jgi:hypothetical protein
MGRVRPVKDRQGSGQWLSFAQGWRRYPDIIFSTGDYMETQVEICARLRVELVPAPANQKLGIALKTVGSVRINGVRLKPENGTCFDLSTYSQAKLNEVARRLNERPRKTLDYETPAQRFHQSVAATG